MEPIRLLLADPHRLVRTALRHLIGKQQRFEVVGTATEGREALDLTQRLAPDVLLLEALITNPHGPRVAAQVEARAIPTRVLVLSRYKRRWMVRRMMNEGVHGYFSKQVDSGTLLDALRRVAAGEDGLLSSLVSQKLFSRRNREVERAERLLTRREWEVMHLVAEGLSNREVARQLYIQPGTARNHVSCILRKLDMSSRSKLMAWAHRHDLLRLPPLNDL